ARRPPPPSIEPLRAAPFCPSPATTLNGRPCGPHLSARRPPPPSTEPLRGAASSTRLPPLSTEGPSSHWPALGPPPPGDSVRPRGGRGRRETWGRMRRVGTRAARGAPRDGLSSLGRGVAR